MPGLAAELLELLNGPEPEPDPVERLTEIAKTFVSDGDVPKHRRMPMRGVAELRGLVEPESRNDGPAEQLLEFSKTFRTGVDVGKSRTVALERLPIDSLQVDDHYQRPIDWGKLQRMREHLRAGGRLKPIKVNRRPDGSLWITDGQHRAAAASYEGHDEIDAHVTERPSWEEQQDCEIVAKADRGNAPENLSADQYRRLEEALEEWEREVRSVTQAYPARSYELGVAQTIAFLRMLGISVDIHGDAVAGLTSSAAVDWLNTHTRAEVDGAISQYLDQIKSAVLYGLRGGVNPAQVATWLFKATRDAGRNWRTIARTEMARANAAGRLDAVKAMGYETVWIPPHTGSCSSCRRLLEDKVFTLEELRNANNYGRKQADWIPALPQHPHCRHVPLPYLPDVVDEARRQTRALASQGLDDKALNEMFDSSGQVKPEYEGDPRLVALLGETGKTADPLQLALGKAVAKVAAERGVAKGYFDHPQLELDPLLWEDDRLRPDVRERIVTWWRGALGLDAPLWSHIYLTGGATSLQWATSTVERDPDVDVQIVVDYPALREHQHEYARLSDPELHAALVTRVKASLDGVEIAPGVSLDAFIRAETTPELLAQDISQAGQALWDVIQSRWIIRPGAVPDTEVIEDGHYLDGLGGALAAQHPEWLKQAHALARAMERLLAHGDNLTPRETARLREAYEFVRELRRRAFAGEGGNAGLGNFLWQYLVNYGPLMQVKRLLHDTPPT